MAESKQMQCRKCGASMKYEVIGLGKKSCRYMCPDCGNHTSARKIQNKKKRDKKYGSASKAQSQRIAVAGALYPDKKVQTIKTYKYPADLNGEVHDRGVAEKIEQAIQEDEIGLLGPSSEYACWIASQKQSEPYSVVDFWFDAVCAGGVFAYSGARLLSTVLQLSGEESVLRAALASSPFVDDINLAQAEKFLAVSRRTGQDKLGKRIGECFAEGRLEALGIKDRMREFVQAIDVAQTAGQRFAAKLKIFGISQMPEAKQWNNDSGLTVCILPDYYVPEENRADQLVVLLRRLREIAYCMGIEDEAGFEHLGIDPGALSNFSNGNPKRGFLGRLLNNDIIALANNMSAMTPYWEGRKGELIERLAWLKHRAEGLYLKEPHFGNSWADHRSRIFSRIAGWLSGCAGKLKIAKDQISGVRTDLFLLKRLLDAVPQSAPSPDFIASISALDRFLEAAESSQDPAEQVRALYAFHLNAPAVRSIANKAVQRSDSQEWLIKELDAVDHLEFNKAFPFFSDTGKKKKKGANSNGAPSEEEYTETESIQQPEDAEQEVNGQEGNGASKNQKKFQRIPRFFGEGSRSEYRILTEAPQYFDMFCNNMRAIFMQLESQPRKAPRDFKCFLQNRLQKLYKQTFLNARSNKCRALLESVLISWGEFYTYGANEKKFRLRHEASERSSDPDYVVQQALEIARRLFLFGFEWRDCSAGERVDLVEIHKKAISFLLAITQAEVSVGSYNWLGNSTVSRYLSVAGTDTLYGTQLEEFLNATVLSQMRGLAIRLSSQELKDGFDVQLESSCQDNLQHLLVYRASRDLAACKRATCPAELDPKILVLPAGAFIASVMKMIERGDEPLAGAYLRHRPHSFGWQIRVRGVAEVGMDQGTALAFQKPTESEPFKIKPFSAQYGPVLWLNSSSYSQSQYLDGFLSQPKNWSMRVLPQAGSVRVEQRVALIWNLQAGKMRLERSGARAFFMPVPFSFRPSGSGDEAVLAPNRYLGLFPHSGGIEYAVVDVLDSAGFKILERGTIAVNGFSQKRGERQEEAHREKQRRGISDIGRKKPVQAEVDAANELHRKYTDVATRLGCRIVVQWAPQPKPGTAPTAQTVYARAVRTEAPRSGNQEDHARMKSSWGYTWSTYWEKRKPEDILGISTQVYWTGGIGESCPAVAVALLGHIRATSTQTEWEKEEVVFGRLKKFFPS
ncbi:hypothetical protein BK004_03505 [bacterium CG10_46_32]|nr:MAG: hypothetical protein BK004_03505 [bacterium CG10_46_32]PIR55935.1 MAG: hypothetical protein COU73_03525 [Parcubacteria group bacterium CG10_big_fil_rev_8_21_14_0_10_46_32]